jgi:hypothetical protein
MITRLIEDLKWWLEFGEVRFRHALAFWLAVYVVAFLLFKLTYSPYDSVCVTACEDSEVHLALGPYSQD